jgi:predicted adenylyl cyclase CyaB
MHLNIEFKARTNRLAEQEALLQQQPNLRFAGEDHQVDTYFHASHGRLKLREGNIEYALIHYTRENTASSKSSHVILYQPQPDPALKHILTAALGVKMVVRKRRRIYFIDHVKFHFDTLDTLGDFVEVEAIDQNGTIEPKVLQQQCDDYARLLGIQQEEYMADSYSDLLLARI